MDERGERADVAARPAGRPADYPAGPRTTPTRKAGRAVFAAGAVHAVLDEALVSHLGLVADGEPLVLPMVHARVGRVLYLHGSTGSRLARTVAATGGAPVCLTATLLDGLVVSRSQTNHSVNYRSVVVRGTAVLVTDPEERLAALAAIVDHALPGRSGEAAPPSAKDLAGTAVLRIDLVEATLKQRSGPPGDDPGDLDASDWVGVIPVTTVIGEPVPIPGVSPNCPLPGGVRARRDDAGPGRGPSAPAGQAPVE